MESDQSEGSASRSHGEPLSPQSEPVRPADNNSAVDQGAETRSQHGEAGRLNLGGQKKNRVGGRARKLERKAESSARIAPIFMPDDGIPFPTGGLQSEHAPNMQPASKATIRKRHRLALYTFLLCVVAPFFVIGGYLEIFAQDQYASESGFSVRKEEGASNVDMIGGLTQLTGAASTDAEILYDFIRSQDLVSRIDTELDLHSIYGKNHATDPFFTLAQGSTIEEKQDYWRRMVTIEYNEGTGLINLEVRAFDPKDAQRVAEAIIKYSSDMINRLSESAREDATRYARAELERAVDRLKDVRKAITEYRSRTQVVDPLIDIQGQVGLLNTLQGQLAEALIELDMLNDVAGEGDPRIAQAERRIDVVNRRLAEERRKFGVGGSDAQGKPDDYASIVAEYERLVVDRQVAEESFRSATIILDAAQAEALRKSRYLAAHVQPTLAEGAIYPRTSVILMVSAFFLILVWAIGILVYYSIRDRR